MVVKPALPPAMPSPILILADGCKGGVGKSFIARITAHLFDRRQLPWVGLDGDNANAHLYRFCRGSGSVSRFDGSHPTEAFDPVLNAMSSSRHILVDLPAGVGVLEAAYPMIAMAAADAGYRIVRLFVLNDGIDSVQQLRASAPSFPYRDTVAVLNKRSPKLDDYSVWQKSNTRELLRSGGGRELTIPLLHQPTQKFADANLMSFAELLALPDLQAATRYNLRHFLKICGDQLDPVLQLGEPL